MIEEKSELHNSGPQLKQHMRILRKKFGADTPIGHRASNVEEGLLNLPHSEQSIRRHLTDIARLAAQPSQLPLHQRGTDLG